MTINTEEFVAEVNSAIDLMEENEGVSSDANDGNATEESEGAASEEKVGEADEGESKETTVEGSAEVDDDSGEGEGARTFESRVNSDDGSAGEAGDQEGGGDTRENTGKQEEVSKKISDHAIEQAVAVGVPLGDAVAFRSDESLLRVVEARRNVAAGVEVRDATESETIEDALAKIPELDPEKFEPETVEMFSALKGIIKQQQESIASIYEQQSTADSMNREAVAREVEIWFDQEVENLGEDFAEALGKGGYSAMPRGSSQLVKRDEIANHMSVMLSGYTASGIEAPARSEIFKAAVRSVLHEEFRQQSNKKVAGKLERRSTQHTQRVGGKKANSHLSPEDETADLLDRKYPHQR